MSIRRSPRILGKEPEYQQLEDTIRNPSNETIIPTQEKIEDNSFFSRGKRRESPVSAPEISSKRTRIQPREVITEQEEIIPLKKDDLIRILSREMPLEKASIIQKFINKSNITNQQVPSIYSSYFFRKDIIKEFQRNLINKIPSDKLAAFPLSTYNLYNKDDILNNTFYKQDRLGTRYTEKNGRYTAESQQNIKLFIDLLTKKICSGIQGDYAKIAVEKTIDLVKNEDKFDILVTSTKVLEDLSLNIEQRISSITSFIIVELGECEKYPGCYSINLICTDLNNALPGTGSILMGAFLYTILSHPDNTRPKAQINFPEGNSFLKVTSKRLSSGSVIENAVFTTTEPLVPVQQIAVLELASSYINVGGLCMYEKFGFTHDPTMFSNESLGIECFDDRDNLPMLINFKTKPGYTGLSNFQKKEKILNITAGLDKGFPKSKICFLRGGQQKLLGYLKSIKLYMDNQPGASLDDYLSSSREGILIYQLKKIHAPPYSGSRRTAPTPSREGTLDEFIDYLENPPAIPNTDMEAKVNKLISYLPKNNKGGRLTRKYKTYSNRYSRKKY
jgi:hypothetical protein